MVSLRFPSFSQPPKLPKPTSTSRRVSSAAFVAASAAASVAAIAAVSLDPKHPFLQKALNCLVFSNRAFSPLWGSLSLADNSSSVMVESKTGVEFPSVLGDSRGLLGIGLRKKSVLGLKNIDVYAFGTTFLVQVPIFHLLFTVGF